MARFLKNNSFLLYLAFSAGLIALDQLAGSLAKHFLTGAATGSFLKFSIAEPAQNCHLIFGWSLGLDPLFANTVLAAVFCASLFYYIVFLVFLPRKLLWLKIGISCVFSGFAGNWIDKIGGSCVLDFIKWAPSPHLSLWFNTADMAQTCGWLIIFAQGFFLRKSIWRANERRKSWLAMRGPQLWFVGFCVLGFICLASFFLLINYQFLAFADLPSFSNIREIGWSFFKFSILILLFLCAAVGAFFFYLSNKIYGPLYAFEKYLKALIKGEKPKKLKLRKNDQFKHLEDLAQEIKKQWDKKAKKSASKK